MHDLTLKKNSLEVASSVREDELKTIKSKLEEIQRLFEVEKDVIGRLKKEYGTEVEESLFRLILRSHKLAQDDTVDSYIKKLQISVLQANFIEFLIKFKKFKSYWSKKKRTNIKFN